MSSDSGRFFGRLKTVHFLDVGPPDDICRGPRPAHVPDIEQLPARRETGGSHSTLGLGGVSHPQRFAPLMLRRSSAPTSSSRGE